MTEQQKLRALVRQGAIDALPDLVVGIIHALLKEGCSATDISGLVHLLAGEAKHLGEKEGSLLALGVDEYLKRMAEEGTLNAFAD